MSFSICMLATTQLRGMESIKFYHINEKQPTDASIIGNRKLSKKQENIRENILIYLKKKCTNPSLY